MKIRIGILVFWFLAARLFGQYALSPQHLDSLAGLLEKAASDSARCELLFQIGMGYRDVDPNKAVQAMNDALAIARTFKNKDKATGCLLTLGFMYAQIGEPVKAIAMNQEALAYMEVNNGDISMPLAFIGMGYEAQGDYQNALEYARKAFWAYEKRRKDGLPHDPRGYPAGPLRFAVIFEKQGRLDSAMRYAQIAYDRVLEKPLDGEMPFFYCQICNILGTLYRRTGQSEASRRFYRLALDKGTEINFPATMADSRLGLAQLFRQRGSMDSAVHHALAAYDMARPLKLFNVLQEAANLLRVLHEQKGDFSKALYFNDLAVSARDSVSGAEKVREVQRLTSREEQRQLTLRREAEAARIAYENKYRIIALSAALGVLALLALLLYRNNHNKQQANGVLQKTLSELETAQTQLLFQKERAEASEAFKSRFLAHMSHEIRTPLHGIAGFAELLADTALTENQRRRLSAIRHSADRLTEVVDDILDFSKLEAGEVRLRQIPFSPARIAQEVCETLALRAENKGIALRVELDKNLPPALLGDPARIYQVLMNLMGNAIKFTEKGTVCLSIESPSHPLTALTLSVRDTGIGIAPAQLSTIFERFQQAGDDTAARFGGTGLGLAIARELVRLHGSDIRVESEAGKGSVFSFVLALPLADAAGLNHTNTPEDALCFTEPLRILLVDDNALNREIAVEAVRRHFENAEIVEAANGKEALALLEAQESTGLATFENWSSIPFDLVLMDIQMPEMSGTEAARHIRRHLSGAKRNIPIIALTASATPEEIEAALASGMNRHLSKPFKPADLARIIAETLKLNLPDDKEVSKIFKVKPDSPAAPDLAFLRDFCNGDEAQMQYFIRKFLVQYPLEINRLEDAVQKCDREAICRAAHDFRPQFEFVGLKDAAAWALKLEQNAQNGTGFEELVALLEQIKKTSEPLPAADEWMI